MRIDRTTERRVTLFSETDLDGTILFANDAFCNVSKYQRDELLNKPHNIIRHPDMPKQLFELLWRTIRNGEVFRGVIKNKASDDSHYWVNATIMPFKDNNEKIVKYVSVRHLISDEKAARELYEAQVKLYKLM
jgi:PAS domain S-box-containing protein